MSRVATRTSTGTLSRSGLASIGAVVSVVVVVSLPLLRRFALSENQIDALGVVRMLGRAAVVRAADVPAVIGDLSLDGVGRGRALPRLESLDGGQLLFGNGYLFDLAIGEAGAAVRAWPLSYGNTGYSAFVYAPDGTLWRSANAPGWSGTERPPEGPWAERSGWCEVPQDADYR